MIPCAGAFVSKRKRFFPIYDRRGAFVPDAESEQNADSQQYANSYDRGNAPDLQLFRCMFHFLSLPF